MHSPIPGCSALILTLYSLQNTWYAVVFFFRCKNKKIILKHLEMIPAGDCYVSNDFYNACWYYYALTLSFSLSRSFSSFFFFFTFNCSKPWWWWSVETGFAVVYIPAAALWLDEVCGCEWLLEESPIKQTHLSCNNKFETINNSSLIQPVTSTCSSSFAVLLLLWAFFLFPVLLFVLFLFALLTFLLLFWCKVREGVINDQFTSLKLSSWRWTLFSQTSKMPTVMP